MSAPKIQQMIKGLIHEMEEEDIGISLLKTYSQSKEEMSFFSEDDQTRILRILKQLSDDSLVHRNIVKSLIDDLSEKIS